MKKLFGTDGIRSVAGKYPLDPPTVYAIGCALAHSLAAATPSPRVLLGMDTRESGPAIAATLSAGLAACGATVENAGVITTPAIAFLTQTHSFSAGIVISASHNPWEDNGIKVFGADGYKLPDATELAIEEEIFKRLGNSSAPSSAYDDAGGRATNQVRRMPRRSTRPTAPTTSASSSPPSPDLSLDNRRIVIDCANGAASAVAPELFAQLGGHDVVITHASPDGRNINRALRRPAS